MKVELGADRNANGISLSAHTARSRPS
jgi:hypothetical protein